MLDQAAISMKTFQDQVYVTVFGNHDGHTSMEQRLKDLQCVLSCGLLKQYDF